MESQEGGSHTQEARGVNISSSSKERTGGAGLQPPAGEKPTSIRSYPALLVREGVEKEQQEEGALKIRWE